MKETTPPYFKQSFSFFPFLAKKWITSAVACVAGVVILIVYFQAGPKPEAFAAAEEAVAKWESSQDEVSYQEMQTALKKVPALAKKYEAVIAQRLFEGDKMGEALLLAHRSLSRAELDAPFHASYGATSLLIEQGSYQDALEKSVGLKEQMTRLLDWSQKEPLAGGALLYAHNLVRIACLQKELNNKPGEKAAWEELESFLKGKDDLAHLIFGNFQEKQLDLTDYINERQKQL